MNFFKGLFSVSLVYTVFFLVYHYGYSKGVDTEKTFTAMANSRLQNCNLILAGD